MSIIHYIKNKKKLDFTKLRSKLEAKFLAVKIESRGVGNYYIWIDGKSTKGVDVTIYDDRVEIRNTTLSNDNDYKLTNFLGVTISVLTRGKIYSENDKQLRIPILFSKKEIVKIQLSDCDIMISLCGDNEISIYGPIRKIHFGKRLHQKLNSLRNKPEFLISTVLNLILKVQYGLPEYTYGTTMEMVKENTDTPYLLKLITNTQDTIIDKYEYIMFNKPNCDDEVIMIKNDTLNKILPVEWELIDEYMIIAPILKEQSWNELVEKANQLNEYDVFGLELKERKR